MESTNSNRDFIFKCITLGLAVILLLYWINVYSDAKQEEVSAQRDAVTKIIDAIEDSNQETRDALVRAQKNQLESHAKIADDALTGFANTSKQAMELYSASQQQNAAAQKEQSNQTQQLVHDALKALDKTEEKRVYSQFWNTKLNLFQQVAGEAMKMAHANTANDYDKAREGFLALYRGELALVLGEKGQQAIDAFMAAVPDESVLTDNEKEQLKQAASALSVELRRELSAAIADPATGLTAE